MKQKTKTKATKGFSIKPGNESGVAPGMTLSKTSIRYGSGPFHSLRSGPNNRIFADESSESSAFPKQSRRNVGRTVPTASVRLNGRYLNRGCACNPCAWEIAFEFKVLNAGLISSLSVFFPINGNAWSLTSARRGSSSISSLVGLEPLKINLCLRRLGFIFFLIQLLVLVTLHWSASDFSSTAAGSEGVSGLVLVLLSQSRNSKQQYT